MVLLAVFLAGALGTTARLGIDAIVPAQPGNLPLSTLLINTVGSFALGVLGTAIPHSAPEWLRAGATTGLLGSFTTFSALTVAAVQLTGSGEVLSAAALLILSVAAGVAAAVAGIAVGALLQRRRA
ncbi:MAG: CrcB family protein [Actinomycetota bacterium]|nr:CrcB family protein [Actinomycetota bacterium]